MDFDTKERIRAMYRAQGVEPTDSQILNYYNEANQQKYGVSNYDAIDEELSQTPTVGQVYDSDEGLAWQLGEGVLNAAWSGIDTALLGAPGLAWKTIDEESYSGAMDELNDNALSRSMGAIGNIAGFMAPIGLVGRGLATAGRAVQTASGLRALKAGEKLKNIKAPTTELIQKAAGWELNKKIAKIAGKNSLPKGHADEIIKSVSDDIIGFSTEGMGKISKIYQGGRAYTLDMGLHHVNNARKMLQANIPTRLATELKRRGITNISNKQIKKLSDEMVDMLGTQPFNNIDTIIRARYGTGELAKSIFRIAASSAQEGVAMVAVGSMMDAMYHFKDELSYDEKSFGSRAATHLLLGGAFGGIKFAPGGTQTPNWQKFYQAAGFSTRHINKYVSGVKNIDELKAFARSEHAVNANYLLNIDGRRVTGEMLRQGRGITAADMSKLKKAIIDANNTQLRTVNGSYWKNIWAEAGKDIWGSMPRMAAGSLAFNMETYFGWNGGSFDYLSPNEVLFHLGLGAVMSKRGLALSPDTAPRAGIHSGQRPFYYNSEMENLGHSLERMGVVSRHIGDVVKQFHGNTWTDWVNRNPQPDAENMINILREHDVIYDSSIDDIKESSTKTVSPVDQDLTMHIQPLTAVLISRNLSRNPYASKENQKMALAKIKKLQSESLGTVDNPVLLDSPSQVRRAMIVSTKKSALDMQDRIMSLHRDLYAVLTERDGKPMDEVNEDGYRYDMVLDDAEIKQSMEAHEPGILRKFHDIDEFFRKEGIIKVRDIETNTQKGLRHKVTHEKLEKMNQIIKDAERIYGEEVYGAGWEFPEKVGDRAQMAIISEINHENSIANVSEVMNGRETHRTSKDDAKDIRNLIEQVLKPDNENLASVIVARERNIVLDTENFNGTSAELHALELFKRHLWKIQATEKDRAPNNAKSKVDANIVAELVDKLVDAGMPDPMTNITDPRWMRWVEKMVTYNTDKLINENLATNPHKANAVKKLLEAGIINIERDSSGSATRLSAPMRITRRQVLNAFQNMTNEGADLIVKKYNDVLDNIGHDVISRRDDLHTTALDADQINALVAADYMMNHEKLATDIVNASSELASFHQDSQNRIQSLEDARIVADDPDAAKEITDLLDFERQKDQVYADFLRAFNLNFSGSPEMVRAAAYLEYVNTSVTKDGETIFDLFKQMKELDQESEFDLPTVSEKIKQLILEIDQNTQNAPHVRTSWDEMAQEAYRSRNLQEVEGHNKSKDDIHTDPDKFMQDYDITPEDLLQGTDLINANFESNADALHKLYQHHRANQTMDQFIDRLFEVAGDKTEKLRSEVVQLHNLMERRFKIKRLTMNENGRAVFENSEMSHGWLTDIYTELFGSSPMIMLNSQYMKSNGSFGSMSGDPDLFNMLSNHLKDGGLQATLSDPISHYADLFRPNNEIQQPESSSLMDGYIPIDEQLISGEHYTIVVDENITLALPESGFDSFAKGFIDWYDNTLTTNGKWNTYYKSIMGKNNEAAKQVLRQLKDYRESLTLRDGKYDAVDFTKSAGDVNGSEYLHNAMHTIFNSMYSERVNGNWVQNIYFDGSKGTRKHVKYKRLAQNQGYSRNSDARRQAVQRAYAGSGNKRIKKLLKDFTDLEHDQTFVVDDGYNQSEMGGESQGLITDSRAVAQHRLKEMENNGLINQEQREQMERHLKEASSIHAEQVNGQTIASKDYLDYLLLLNGDEALIGRSAGQKPVGLTSWTDDSGNIHVMYNKTHYFYDKNYDEFFKNNPNVHKIAFESGTKIAEVIDPTNLKNTFESFKDIPSVDSGKSLYDMINNLKLGDDHSAVMKSQFNQNLSGVNYGEPHDAKILKQLGNWSGRAAQQAAYKWARQDMAKRFVNISVDLYDPNQSAVASAEARSFIRNKQNKDGTFNAEAGDASTAIIWIEGGGIPFEEAISKGMYDSMIKRRYLDEAGVFDGYTDAGGAAVLRGNSALDLNIPIFDQNQKWIRVGESKIGEEFLDRNIHNINDYGAVKGFKGQQVTREKFLASETLTIVLEADGRDILIDLKTGNFQDPLGESDARVQKTIKSVVQRLQKSIAADDGVRTYRELLNEINADLGPNDSPDLNPVKLAIMGLPAPRTGPHDAIITKVKGTLPRADGGIIEMNSYDLTMRAQRDMDTDKMYFYMDTPSEIMKQAFSDRILVSEARPKEKSSVLEVNPLERNSMNQYVGNINKYKKRFGTVVKTHRKLTYMKNIMEQLGGGIKLADGTSIVFNTTPEAMQRLVSDTQAAVDLYNGLPEFLSSLKIWEDNILFNKSPANAFFNIDSGKGENAPVHKEGHKYIIKKIMNDFGKLLSYEGNIFEAGEAKNPRYQDMVTGFRMFKDQYDPLTVNQNFYRYIKSTLGEPAAKEMFIDSNNQFKDVLGDLAVKISNNEYSDNFLKSLNMVASRDRMRIKTTYSSANDHFNGLYHKMVSRMNAEEYQTFLTKGFDGVRDGDTPIMDTMWEAFYKSENAEQTFAQINYIEQQIRSVERLLNNERSKDDSEQNKAFIQMHSEDLALKRASLLNMIDRVHVATDKEKNSALPGQKIIAKKGAVMSGSRDFVIRDAKTGKLIDRNNREGGESYTLKDGEVGIYNPVTLRAATEHDIISGTAWARSTLSYYARIQDTDLSPFRDIVYDARKEIKRSISEIMDTKGVKDWDKHEAEIYAAIEKGLKEVSALANREGNYEGVHDSRFGSFIGLLPEGKKSYGIDFIMSMLVPDGTRSNEFYFNPQSGELLNSVRSQSKSVVSGVFKALDAYDLLPNKSEFIKELADVHRGHYDAIVSGKGFRSGMARLQESSFEGALSAQLDRKIANSAFTTPDMHQGLTDFMEIRHGVDIDFYNLMYGVLEEGMVTDPHTMTRIKNRIIEEYGEEAYRQFFEVSRGDMYFDGISTKQFSKGDGRGQLLGEIVQERSLGQGRLRSSIGTKEGTPIRDKVTEVVGFENEHGPDKPPGC